MLKNQKLKITLVTIFCIIEAILFFLVQTTNGDTCVFVSYLSIILAFAFMITNASLTKNYFLMQIGLLCTLGADLFLVVLEPIQELPAMFFFSGTQICYFLRLYFNQKTQKEKNIHLILRAGVSVLAIIIAIIVLKENTDALSIVSMFYYSNLVVNVIVAFTQCKTSILFPIGLLLFLCCDTVIGIDVMLSDYLHSSNSSAVTNALFSKLNWSWIFYLPSQALIALSLTKFKDNNQGNGTKNVHRG